MSLRLLITDVGHQSVDESNFRTDIAGGVISVCLLKPRASPPKDLGWRTRMEEQHMILKKLARADQTYSIRDNIGFRPYENGYISS